MAVKDKVKGISETSKCNYDVYTSEKVDEILEALLPIGTIIPFGGEVAPSGWLICDGSALNRTTYAKLFGAIGTKYGVGDGSTTFNLPDLKGKVLVGKDASQTEFADIGKTGGEATVTLKENEIPSHNHYISGYTIDPGSGENTYVLTKGSIVYGAGNTDYTGGGQAHNNLQPYLVANYIIRF